MGIPPADEMLGEEWRLDTLERDPETPPNQLLINSITLSKSVPLFFFFFYFDSLPQVMGY